MGRIAFNFFGISIFCAVFFAALVWLFPALGSPSGSVTTVIASLITGQIHGRQTGEEVTSGFAWKVALLLTMLSLAIAVPIFSMLKAQGAQLPDMTIQGNLILFAFIAFLSILAIRFTFRFGVKQGAAYQ